MISRWSNPKESSRLPEHEHGYTLTLKSPPKQLAKPIATYSYSTNQDTQPRQGLKTWERAGSVISNPGGSLHQRGPATMQRSVSQPRTMGYDNVFGTTNGRTNYPTQQNGLANSQGQPNSMKQRDLAKSENNPFNHPFFYSNGNKDLSSTGPPPLVTTVDNIDGSIVQDSFKWQKERKNLNTKNGILPTQIDNNTTYYTIRRPPRPGTNFPPADNSDKIDLPVYHSDSMQGKSKPVPFTKRTGKKGQEHFLRLMKPVPDRSNEPALGRVFSLPLFPRRQAEHFDEQPDHRIIGQPDDEVTYENLPFQTSTINGRGFERRGNMVRSRSCSPMIYADVTPPNNRNVLTNQRQPRDNQNRISKNTGSLPFGDGLAFVPGKTKRVHQPPPQRNENIPPKSKTPSEYSISLGTPEELRRRMTKLNINTNPTSHSYDDRGNAKPFPNSIHLEQMLSDTSSSQKSGTIKSVLKQPSDKFPLVVCTDMFKYFFIR